MPKSVQLSIQLDASQRQPASAGSIVRGVVVLHLSKPIMVQCIRVNFYGQSTTSWHETETHQIFGTFRRPTLDSMFTGKDVYFDQQLTLIGAPHRSEDTCEEIQPGVYHHQFQFVLPRSCPSTFSGKYGSVKYTLTAKLERPRKSSRVATLPVSIVSIYDLSAIPNVFTPVTIEKTQTIRKIIWNNGKVICQARLHHRGYLSGDPVGISISLTDTGGSTHARNEQDDLTNNATVGNPPTGTGVQLKEAQISLVREIVYRAYLHGHCTGTDAHSHQKSHEIKVISNTVSRGSGTTLVSQIAPTTEDVFYTSRPVGEQDGNFVNISDLHPHLHSMEEIHNHQPRDHFEQQYSHNSVIKIPLNTIPTYTEPNSLIKVHYFVVIKVSPVIASANTSPHRPIKLRIPIVVGSRQPSRNSLLNNFQLIGQSLLGGFTADQQRQGGNGNATLSSPLLLPSLFLPSAGVMPVRVPDHPPPSYEESFRRQREDHDSSHTAAHRHSVQNDPGPPPAYEEPDTLMQGELVERPGSNPPSPAVTHQTQADNQERTVVIISF